MTAYQYMRPSLMFVLIVSTMVVQAVTHVHQSARHSDLGQEPGTVEA